MAKHKTIKNPDPYSITIEDIQGNPVLLEALPMTMSVMAKIANTRLKMDDTGEKDGMEIVVNQLCIIFDKTKDFFIDFDFRVLSGVLTDFTGAMSDPIKG